MTNRTPRDRTAVDEFNAREAGCFALVDNGIDAGWSLTREGDSDETVHEIPEMAGSAAVVVAAGFLIGFEMGYLRARREHARTLRMLGVDHIAGEVDVDIPAP